MKNLYDPTKAEEQKPIMEEYFDFKTRSAFTLDVNYDTPNGIPILMELYTELPIAYTEAGVRMKRTDIKPIFMAFTDESGRYKEEITLSAGVSKVFLYTREMAVPECVLLEVKDNAIVFDNTYTPDEAAETRANYSGTTAPYVIDAGKKLYSLTQWSGQETTGAGWRTTTTYLGKPQGPYYSAPNREGIPIWEEERTFESYTKFASRLKSILWSGERSKAEAYNNEKLDNKELVSSVDQTNFYIGKETEVQLMFLNERAGFKNTFGYYYYKGSGERNVDDLRKYVIFPNVSMRETDDAADNTSSNDVLRVGSQVSLQFFGEDGTDKASSIFPEGYTIGWFLIPEGFNPSNGNVQNIDKMCTSNQELATKSFISIYDQKLRGVVVGAEDGGDTSYEDMLFCVFTKDMDAIIDPENPGRPYIPKGVEGPNAVTIPEIVEDESLYGTLAFEDVWPSGGDYDLNDVVVEFQRIKSFNTKNEVVKVKDIFTPVHNGATFVNAFAYQITSGKMGTVVKKPESAVVEEETSSIVLYPNHALAVTNPPTEYVVERDLTGLSVKSTDLLFNPFIIPHYEPGNTSRIEVHLPLKSPTPWADTSLNFTADDAYYVDEDGKYPFAIDISKLGFKVATESVRIDAETEYPDFRPWAESNGTTYTKWYDNYKGGKKAVIAE
ncbi:MAG: LruC domain-containing protein [Mediterranea sp.]|jgi:LruC domain-containing protein|nr:LruC domain-containing protein [Mediterranea sp.]